MHLSTSDLLARCVASGLIDFQRAGRWQSQLSSAGIIDGTIAAERLVAANKLTTDQAATLLQDAQPLLAVGSWRLQTRATNLGLPSHWWHAIDDQNRAGLIGLWKPLSGFHWQPPDSTSEPRRLVIPQTVELAGNRYAAVVTRVPHKTLGQLLASRAWDDPQLALLARRMAAILSELSSSPSIPMTIMLGHWWFEPSLDQLSLLCDPSLAMGAWLPAAAGSSPPAELATFTAPEILLQHVAADSATLVYSVGCNLYAARFGEPPFRGRSFDELAAQHATARPEQLSDLTHAGPILRSVAHAMAKSRDSRFPDIRAFEQSLPSPLATDKTSPSPGTTEKFSVAPASAHSGSSAPVEAVLTKPSRAGATMNPVVVAESQAADVINAPRQVAPRSAPENAIESKTVSMPGDPDRISRTAMHRPRRVRRKSPMPWIIGSLSLIVLGLLITFLIYDPGRGRSSELSETIAPPRSVTSNPTANRSSAASPVERVTSADPRPPVSNFELVDDSQILWAPPTDGQPVRLQGVPNSPQALVAFRPAALADAAGKQLASVLAPEIDQGLLQLERIAGVELSKIREVVIAFFGGRDGWPTPVFVIRLNEPVLLGELRSAWGSGLEPFTPAVGDPFLSREPAQGPSIYAGPRLTTDDVPISWFVSGPREAVLTVAENAAADPLMPRQMAELWAQTDQRSAVSFVALPNFLFADGRELLLQYAPRAIDPLKSLLIPDAHGLFLRSDLSPQWYLEVRVTPGTEAPLTALVDKLRKLIFGLPAAAETRLLSDSLNSPDRGLAIRLPAMLRALAEQSRFGVSRQQATFNAFLPANAAPSFVLTSWLSLGSGGGESGQSVAITPTPDDAGPAMLEQLLDRPMSVAFDQEGLQAAAMLIASEANAAAPAGSATVEVFLMGNDMERDGITKNQQVREFRFADTPLREVLTALVMRANPVTTVTSPTESDQKLVWVIGPHPEQSDRKAVLITTRTAAAGKYELPKEFTATN